jgi:hypothetical protein
VGVGVLSSAACNRADGQRSAICKLTAPIRPEMHARHITFSDVVVGTPADFSNGVGNVLVFSRAAGVIEVEPAYRPSIDFIVERTLAEEPALADDAVPARHPVLTDEVVRSARNLDADLDAGACD